MYQSLPHQISFLHGMAILAFVKKDIRRVQMLLQEVMELSKDVDVIKYSRARNWMADSYLLEGRFSDAEALFRASLADSLQINYHRSITYCQARLAIILLSRADMDEAEQFLNDSYRRAQAVQDRRDLALILRTYAQLYVCRGDTITAAKYFSSAIDLFERLGMRSEFAEAREELRRLEEMGEAPVA